jgi:hypothetical protein
MKLVFCGTPSFAVPTLEALLAAGHEIALVVSQPDRPVGRTQQLTAPPVKQAALAAGLAVTQPEKIRNNASFAPSLRPLRRTPSSSSPTGASFRRGCWRCRAWAASICTGRCCPSTAARRPSNGPWPWATPSPATPRCCLKKASTRADSAAADRRNWTGSDRGRTVSICSPIPARRWS